MAITGVTTNYSNRQKDVNIFFGTNPYTDVITPVKVEIGKISSFVAGIQKLIQRYAISLLTDIGSQTNFAEFGTDLLQNLSSGSLVGIADLRHKFNFANRKVVNVFLAYQTANPSLPDDEKILSVTLQNVVLDKAKGMVSLVIALTAVSGDKTKFLLPLPVH